MVQNDTHPLEDVDPAGRAQELGSRARIAEARRPHRHVYARRADGFGGQPDAYCVICGFRIPASCIGNALQAGATILCACGHEEHGGHCGHRNHEGVPCDCLQECEE